MNEFRVYEQAGKDGYPAEWHHEILVGARRFQGIKDAVRSAAGHRCVRCGHPYQKGMHGSGEWTPCSKLCQHAGPYRVRRKGETEWHEGQFDIEGLKAPRLFLIGGAHDVEAQWRILTVHHLNGDKLDCRWWNLASLCQRCHLTIQGRVVMERVYPWEHSEWFKPYAAGYYASVYLGEELTRDQVVARLDELLGLERVA